MINIPEHQAYFILTLPFFIIWLLLYLFSPKTRREQLTISLILFPIGTLSELLYFQDYWKPLSILRVNIGPIPLLIEDFIFVIGISGIGAVMYKFLFHKYMRKNKKQFHTYLGLPVISFIALVITLVLFYLGINSIFATSIGFIVVALLIILQRKDLLADSLLSGLCVMGTMFIGYTLLYHLVNNVEVILKQQWLLYGTPLDIRILHIPLTEMIWGFSWGIFVGPLYSFINDLTIG